MTHEPLTLLLAASDGLDWSLPEALLADRFRLRTAPIEELEAALREPAIDAVLLRLPEFTTDLPDRVQTWKQVRPTAQLFLFLEAPPANRALVALLHAGCQDVLDSPGRVDMGLALASIEERVRFVRLHQLERLQAKHSVQYTGLVGESPEMVQIYDHMLRAARLNCPVLVLGETGTGKGLVAHAIHALSQRSGKPFVTVDCGCLAPTLIESELYGAARGAFTGASSDRSGLVQAAQQGTLFLDEIGELPLGMQPKLLRLLEEREIRRLGSARPTSVDVRVISATSRDLENLIASNQFRLDLFYRLNVLSIELPPLRQRAQDVPLLARHFASRHTIHGEPVRISESALEALAAYPWPGNVRELKNCLETALAVATSGLLQPQHLPARFLRPGQTGLRGLEWDTVNLKRLERRAIQRALDLAGQDKSRAARMLGIGKTTLYRKLKEISAETSQFDPASTPYLM
jgi:two-component system response regulator AtoC